MKPGKVPLRAKLAFGVGGSAENLVISGIAPLANPIYTLAFGVSPFLVGLALSIPRLWDAVVDPLVGNFSDNLRSRWGRRRPLIAIGAVAAGVAFALIWRPPAGASQHVLFAYLLGALLLLFTAAALFSVPWNALGFELAVDYDERTRVMAFRAAFTCASGFAIQWLYALTQWKGFGGEINGSRWVGAGVGVLIALAGLCSACFCREREAEQASHQPKISLRKSLMEAMRTKPFMLLMGAVLLIQIGLFMVHSLGFFLIVFYVEHGNRQAAAILTGWTGTMYNVVMALAVAPVTWLSTRLGKRRALALALALAFVGTVSKWFCFTPAHPTLVFVTMLLMAPALTSFGIIVASMIADVCDWDEWLNGSRREGIFSSVYAWASKCGLSLAFALSGVVLKATGFDQHLAQQSARTLLLMRLCFSVLPTVSLCVGIVLVLRYPITAEKAREIRAALDLRRLGAPASTDLPPLPASGSSAPAGG